MKGKALRKQSLHGKSVSVLLKLFISGNERCHTTDEGKKAASVLCLFMRKKYSFKNKNTKIRKTQKYMFSKCLLRNDVVRVFVPSLVLVFVRAILSWCP